MTGVDLLLESRRGRVDDLLQLVRLESLLRPVQVAEPEIPATGLLSREALNAFSQGS